ncbi:MAG: helix-turn-helix domain-containing protein, partial [Anaerolineales bacterium]
MTTIGEELRAAREAKGVSLEDAERATRIRLKFLTAMEASDLSAFASPAQARGFLRNYAAYLGLDAEALLASFVPAARRPRVAAPVNGRTPAQGMPPVRLPWYRRLFTRDLFIGVLVTALVLLVLGWGVWQFSLGVLNPLTETATPTRRPASLAFSTLAATGTPTQPVETPTAPLPTALPNYVGVNVVVRAEQRLWLRVVVDGAESFVGQMVAGETREFVGNTVVELWTGNGRGTRVVFNGNDQGVLGNFGEVVIRLWTLEGAVTPTP